MIITEMGWHPPSIQAVRLTPLSAAFAVERSDPPSGKHPVD
jgi:hypothetical protein